jgi:hypothetical protein
MPVQDKAERVCRSCKEILKRLSLRKAKHLRRGVPGLVLLSKGRSYFVMRLPLPCPLVEIIKLVENLHWRATGLGNGRARCHATAHRTRVDCRRRRCCGDLPGGGVGLRHTQGRERNVGASAKTWRFDAIDVAVAGQNDSCLHPSNAVAKEFLSRHFPLASRRQDIAPPDGGVAIANVSWPRRQRRMAASGAAVAGSHET